jgi:sodium transport system ATP-binding protein
LKGFDFDAYPGQVTGILGPNGSGKTTFFRGIAGLESFNEGSLLVDGINPEANPSLIRGKVALLPEEPGIYSHDTGLEHLTLFGVMSGLSKEENRVLLEESDEMLGLSSFWTRDFRTYSRGQKSRIALARLHFFKDANVLIFDEPSNGLDFESVGRLHRFIRQKAKEGKTVLVASHIVNDLKNLCDRIVGIQDGRAADEATVNQWIEDHALATSSSLQGYKDE